MDRTILRGNGFAWGALLACALSASACGDPSCPAGSVSVGGRCEPAAEGCGEGKVENDAGECVAEFDVKTDAGLDGAVEVEDAAVDETVSRDASVNDAAEQDSEVFVPVNPLCEGVDCGDHGTCDVVAGETVCECDEGYDGEQCDACEIGLALQDGECVPPCEADDAPDCGDNGECRVSGGNAICMCEHPFTGEDCTDCAEGFALQTDGTCKPDCGVCGAHSFCNEELMTPSCECVAGYGKTGAECIWVGDGTTGGVVDGDLENPDVWLHDYLSIADGFAEFENVTVGGVCQLGRMEQTIRMPTWESAEPLVLEIAARATCTYADAALCPALLVDIGDTVTRLPMGGGPSPVNGTLTACLGKAAYQEEVLLRVRPALSMENVNPVACSAAWPSLQRIGIRRASPGECPNEGALLGALNGAAGWTLRSGAAIGSNKMTLTSSGEQASTFVSVPANGGVALRVTTPTPLNTLVLLDGMTFQNGTNTTTTNICFPKWTFGSVHRIGFGMIVNPTEITSLSVQADSACASGELDGGFERPLGTGSWTSFFVAATIATNVSHSPTHAWRVPSTQTVVSALLMMPGYGDDAVRPAFSAWMRVQGTNMRGTLRFSGAGFSNHSIETTSQAFGKSVACVGEEWAGQPAFMVVSGTASMTSGSGTPLLWVDDMEPDTIDASACD